ncbi:uncharacterized protein LAESUDRAFT_764586 [Laetiporus sulphureus 93-53]|uniref:Uncharacterized protein n=1 Tax=Laetiporus sulphureus 93-53 TaxID=1314785 RepID=A0A165B7X4_9APHY|nr:uncharacterized protein LAESUDRAFT_764586 [Laetiporus sulphureus 93-53]KZT00448.1 hypothetical protein LAESUDRAFT_764586 [Laetiporus sulphureus 93-53]
MHVCKTGPPSSAVPQQEGESEDVTERIGGRERTIPVCALMSLTTMACKDAVSFVRRYRLPRTQPDGSTAYGHALLAVSVASRTRARLHVIATIVGESGRRGGRLHTPVPSSSSRLTTPASSTGLEDPRASPRKATHARLGLERLRILVQPSDDSTAYGHGIIAVNVASRMRARLHAIATVVSGVSGARVVRDQGARRWARANVGGVVCTRQTIPPRSTTPAHAADLDDPLTGPHSADRPLLSAYTTASRPLTRASTPWREKPSILHRPHAQHDASIVQASPICRPLSHPITMAHERANAYKRWQLGDGDTAGDRQMEWILWEGYHSAIG